MKFKKLLKTLDSSEQVKIGYAGTLCYEYTGILFMQSPSKKFNSHKVLNVTSLQFDEEIYLVITLKK